MNFTKGTILYLMLAFALVVGVASPANAQRDTPLKIQGKTEYGPYQLVTLESFGGPGKAALVWRVTPSKDVQRADTIRDKIQFVAPPGTYEVELMAIRVVAGEAMVDEARVTVTISPPPGNKPGADARPPVQPPIEPSKGRQTVLQAIGKIQFGQAGCTATIIAPRRGDGRYDVLTASHCVPGVGSVGRMTLKSGLAFTVTVAAYAAGPDLCWLTTDSAELGELPTADLGDQLPAVGAKVWHAGYGVDRPGNVEEGAVIDGPAIAGRIAFKLNVSSGDSGGAILADSGNRVLAAVCCTMGRGQLTTMWGGSCVEARRLRPKSGLVDAPDDWQPLGLPILTVPDLRGP